MHKETMTSRQRVIKAINHEKTDRMPIDMGVHFSTGISAFAYWNLREKLGLSTDNIELIDTVQCLARVDEDIISRFHIDTMLLNPKWQNPKWWNPRDKYQFKVPESFNPVQSADGGWKLEIGTDKLYMPTGGYFFDGAWPDFYCLSEPEKLDYFAKNAEKIYKETDKFTIFMGLSGFFGGIEFACDMLTDPDITIEANEKLLIDQTAYFNRINTKMGKYINAIELNSDLGMQNALMCTPSSYEEIVYPYLKKFCKHVHETSDIKIFMHSCGAIAEALPFIIDAGVDIINPVQISANGMDPQTIKDKFGDKICFWGGGCETQTVFWQESPEFIKKHATELIKIFAKNSGYVFNQVHNIMGNIPPENIIALYDTAYENSFMYSI